MENAEIKFKSVYAACGATKKAGPKTRLPYLY